MSARYCEGDNVAAWLDQSANGIGGLKHHQSGQLIAIAVNQNICNDLRPKRR